MLFFLREEPRNFIIILFMAETTQHKVKTGTQGYTLTVACNFNSALLGRCGCCPPQVLLQHTHTHTLSTCGETQTPYKKESNKTSQRE